MGKHCLSDIFCQGAVVVGAGGEPPAHEAYHLYGALEAELGIKVTGWESLLDPALKGKIVTANPTSSSSAWNNLQCILTDFGGWDSEEAWDYIAKLMQNGLVVVSSSSIPSRSTFSGEYVVGLTYEPSVVKMLDGGQTGAHMVFPEEGTTSVGFASAIIKGAKNLENAVCKGKAPHWLHTQYRRERANHTYL